MLQELLHGLIAQSAGGTDGGAAPGGALGGMLVPIILIGALMYFLIIRPQNQQQKKQQELLSQLKKGDDVILQSGLFGKVFEVRPDEFVIELAPNVKVRVLKSAVSGLAPTPQSAGGKADAKNAEPEKKS